MFMKKKYFIAGISLIVLFTVITYSNHFHNAFQFDDSHVIENNLYIRDINNLWLFFKDGTTGSTLPSNQAYRPLVTASLAIDYWLGHGYNLFYFHLSTFIIYLILGVLLILIFRKIFTESKKDFSWTPFLAIFTGALYMLHPSMAETVNYVSARSDIQSTFFAVLALFLYIYSPFCRKYLLYLIPVIIGGFAKPPIVMFAPILFVYILLFEEKMDFYQIAQKKYSSQTVRVVIKTLPAIITCVILYWFINKMTPNTWQAGGNSPFLYLITQPFVILHYFASFFLPISLSADTDWQLLENIWDYRFFVGLLFIIILLFIAFRNSKKQELRPISFGIIWFFLALVPTSTIIPLGEVLNDHRMFFPFIGLAISVVWYISFILEKNKALIKNKIKNYPFALILIAFLILVSFAYGTYQRNKVWKTSETLWFDVINKSPNNPRGLMNYGLTLMAKGDYHGALDYFLKAQEKAPDYSTLFINIAVAKNALGDFNGAETCYKKAISLNQLDPNAYSFYAHFLMNQQRNKEAAQLINKGLELSPKHQNLLLYKLQNDLLLTDSSAKNNKEAALVQLAQKVPTPENYLNLSLEYYNEGEFQKCIDVAKQAILLKPDYDLAYNNICAAYNRLKKWDDAINAGQKGIKINPNNQLLRNNLSESLKRGQ